MTDGFGFPGVCIVFSSEKRLQRQINQQVKWTTGTANAPANILEFFQRIDIKADFLWPGYIFDTKAECY